MTEVAMVAVWFGFFLLIPLAGATVGIVLLLRWILKSPSAQKVFLTVLIGAGIVALFGLLFVLIMIPVRSQQSARLRAEHVQHMNEAAQHAGAPPYGSAWEDPGSGPAVPAWVKDPALLRPEPQRVQKGRWQLTYVCPDGQDRLAGYSALEPGAAEARARAWSNLRTRLRALFLARCMIEAPDRVERHGPDLLARDVDAAVAARSEFTATAAQIFEDEVDRPDIPGRLFRAAVLVTVPAGLIHDIAAEALTRAEEDAKAERETFRTRVYSFGGAAFLFFVILSIYLFLSAHARGIFTWPLRLAAILIYVAAVFGFVMLLYNLS